MNLYGYANGDPINFSDPFGLCPPQLDCGDDERYPDPQRKIGRDLNAGARDLIIREAGERTGSELGAAFVAHFFQGGGQAYELSGGEFDLTAATLQSGGTDQSPGTRQVDFYGTSLAGAYGRATATFGDRGLTGIRDTYDFNSGPLFGSGARPWGAEIKTRLMNALGTLFGGSDFEIRGGR